MGKPWERQPGESPPAWEAFKTYRDMGRTRSAVKVSQKLGKSRTLINRWSARNGWVQRVADWDAEQDRLWQLELRETRRKAAARNLAVAQGAMKAVAKSVLQLAQQDAPMKPQDVARLMDSASKLEQLALGQPTENVTVAEKQTPADEVDLESLTDEEIRLHLVALRRQLDVDLAEYGGLEVTHG